ncbi:hypothetical protein J3R82DRAFT_11818 [Butyriboletus roseoflavus]|nr:hypothetical protein J3R82DRAFT_11818 [Butyriboletus roseoflavus]
MLSLNDISAWIEVDGKELEQYGVEEDLNQSQVTCWIPTQADKGFSVVFKDHLAYRDHSLGSFLYLDGSSVGGKVLHSPTRNGDFPDSVTNRTVVQKGQTLSATSSRPFMFAKLELTDEDEYLYQASMHLGEIRIHIYRVQPLESYVSQHCFGVPGHGKVHERSKKAVTHCVSYGQEAKTATQYSCRVTYLDGNTPLVTFIFKYRDFSLLQANGIIPMPPPAKKKAAIFEDVLDLTAGDGVQVKPEPVGEGIKIVDNATKKRTAALSKRSKPNRESEARPAKRIKREGNFVPTGEVIDLT